MNQVPPIVLAHNNWAFQPRARRAAVPLFTTFGKHYGRTIHHTIPLPVIFDAMRPLLRLQQDHPAAGEQALQNPMYRFYAPILDRVGPSLDNQVRDDVDWSFCDSCATEFHKGRSQGRSDDIVCMNKVLSQHQLFSHLAIGHERGFPTDEYANLLRTTGLDVNDPDIREALNRGIIDAPSNQLFAGLYTNGAFPAPNAHPLEGCFEHVLFIDLYLGVFCGPRAAKHMSPGSAGHRSKAYRNNMTTVTKASIAYVAMLIGTKYRFTLHQAEFWYTVESEVDTRYNYYVLYAEILSILEDVVFQPQVDRILARLNRTIFPHTHAVPPNAQVNNAQGSHAQAVAQLHALQAAAGLN